MECGKVPFTATDELFQQIIPKENFKTKIYLVDEDGEHQKEIYYLIKNKFYPYLFNNIKLEIMDIENININVKKSIICVPCAIENIEDRLSGEIIIDNNIVIASADEYYSYPGTLKNVYIADKTIHGGYSLDGKDTAITGRSAYAALLAILALNGREYLKNIMEEVNKLC